MYSKIAQESVTEIVKKLIAENKQKILKPQESISEAVRKIILENKQKQAKSYSNIVKKSVTEAVKKIISEKKIPPIAQKEIIVATPPPKKVQTYSEILTTPPPPKKVQTYSEILTTLPPPKTTPKEIIKGGVVYHTDDSILLVGILYPSPTTMLWSIPKGSLNGNESIVETAEREFYEETGMRVQLKNDTEIKKKIWYRHTQEYEHISVFLYKVDHETEVNIENVLDKKEIKAISWFKIEDILNKKVNCNRITDKIIKGIRIN